jgi:hypothetical protein
MIEFEYLSGGARRVVVIQTSSILSYEPFGQDSTNVILANGREILATAPYPMFRDAVNTVRNQFISLVPAGTA